MALPLKTTADDVRAIAKYLKTKPTGATVSEAKAVAKRIVDPRKLTAYVTWGLITRDDSRLKLADRGWLLARHPERDKEVFREIVGLMKPYKSVVEWVHHQDMPSLDTNDVASHWHEHHVDAVGTANENTLRDNAVCFFNVAEAAGLGTMTIGRGGKATRLDVNREQVTHFIEAGPATPPWDDSPDADDAESEVEAAEEAEVEPVEETPPGNVDRTAPKPGEALRVFISHGSNHDIVEQIEDMLAVTGIQAEIAIAEETTAIPVPEKVLNAMRRCQAGVVAVTVDEQRKDENGGYKLNDNLLIEIGAAFVLYDRRVVLVWDNAWRFPRTCKGSTGVSLKATHSPGPLG
jgi:hypothetical protein